MTATIAQWMNMVVRKGYGIIPFGQFGTCGNLGKGSLLTLLLLLAGGFGWYLGPSQRPALASRRANPNPAPEVAIKITQTYLILLPESSVSHISGYPTETQSTPKKKESGAARSGMKPEPRNLKEILCSHYEGTCSVWQERAFRRVLRWKDDFKDIAGDYPHVDWKRLSAVIKAETQGRTGEQVSRAKAIGMPQIKYQGAWAFLWDALLSQKTDRGNLTDRDYHNANIRLRYTNQLKRIKRHLNEENILVHPTNDNPNAYRKARYATWKNLKSHLKREYKPGEYQVAVDIAAMYLDHLAYTFNSIKQQIEEIKSALEQNGGDCLEELRFSGIKQKRWQRIKGHLRHDTKLRNGSRVRESLLPRLDAMVARLDDPRIYSAAYNFGIRKVLECIESGRKMPQAVENYVQQVSTYNSIFNEIERYAVYS